MRGYITIFTDYNIRSKKQEPLGSCYIFGRLYFDRLYFDKKVDNHCDKDQRLE
jgi:hypothetical protein